MARRRRAKQSARAGLAPGAAVYLGPPRDHPLQVAVFRYDPDRADEAQAVPVDQAIDAARQPGVTWLDVNGIHDAPTVQALCDGLGIHPLAREDILNPAGRPKLESYEDLLFVQIRMVTVDKHGLEQEQVSMAVGDGWLVSFQERPGDVFEGVRKRIRSGTGRLRRAGPDYLLWALLDAIVDHYFVAMEWLEQQVDQVEAQAMDDMSNATPARVHATKGHLSELRRVLWPTREGLSKLMAAEQDLVGDVNVPYFRDLYDHLHQAMDLLEGLRDRLTGALELHLAMTSHRMNETMRVLTIVATLFIPLTFVAGIYGMNFDWMPETEWVWGYPVALGVMLLMAVTMIAWFDRRGWW